MYGSASCQTVMGDDIYDAHLSYKPNVLIPKLNGLSMIKTGSDSDLKETLVHKNGYIHHNEVKVSRSGSQIMFINAAMYVEKMETPRSYSWGDGKYKQNENSCLNLSSVEDRSVLTNETLIDKPLKYINGIVCNGAGDRLSSPVRSTRICEPSEKLCAQAQNNDEDLTENLPTTYKDSQSSSFCSISVEESSSIASCSEDGGRNDTKIIDTYVEKPSVDEQRHLILNEEPIISLQRLFYRSYSDIDRGKASPLAVRSPTSLFETNLAVAVPRRSFTRLSDSSYISTFPEKNIRKKIFSALSEKGDFHNIKFKDLLLQNLENLITYEELAWLRWYISKLQQEKQQKEAKKGLELRSRGEEEKEIEQRLRKRQLDEENLRAWRERKDKENAARRERERRLELEKQKKGHEETRIEKVAAQNRVEWNKKKDSERREQKLKEEQVRKQMEEKERLRAQKSKEAFDSWNLKAKNRPKPMPVAIKDHKGRSDPILARLNWNPIPWRNVVEESKANVPKDPGKKKKKLIKPCST